MVKNSEIRALQNQINAHFIYNVLESIKMRAEIDEEYDISDAVTSLGKLLRYSMKWVSGNVLVEQELEYIKNYMALINLRFDYEIYLSLNLPEIILQQEFPKCRCADRGKCQLSRNRADGGRYQHLHQGARGRKRLRD